MIAQTKGTRTKVLVVDDDQVVLHAAAEILKREGYTVIAVDDAVEALAAGADPSVDVAVLDIKMPNYDGLQLLNEFKRTRPDLEVIMMTGYGTVETAVEAMKAGALEYLRKPFDKIEVLSLAVHRAAERKSLRDRNVYLENALNARDRFEDLIGQSTHMREVFRLVETVSQTGSNVLIQGESGTGKELVARAIHFRSPRRDGPFVAVNCSALTDTLLESELFGHIKGSFTGAIGNKKGLFESANRGTIFLDEIGDVSAATQVRLLRVLQEGEVKPVGATESTKVDVRIIAASNIDLARAKEKGKFREDLFYRLNVLTVALPPLRDRPEDIPLLAYHFLKLYSEKFGKPVKRLDLEALQALTVARWTGNVRELENAIERGVVLASGEALTLADLPPEIRTGARGGGEVVLFHLAHLPYAEAKKLAMRAFERRYLSALLEKSNGNVSQAAREAQVDRSNFRRLLKQYEVAGRGQGLQAGASEAPQAEDRLRIVRPPS